MRDLINKCSNEKIVSFRKSKISKNEDVPSKLMSMCLKGKTLSAFSRGKELQILFDNDVPVTFTMGMSGNWKITKTGKEEKHTHFMVDFESGFTLGLVDPRRFARWNICGFDPKRGPEITDIEFGKFLKDCQKEHNFKKPICEMMMDQRYFNGSGNYIRSEVLYKMDVDPFQTLEEIVNTNLETLTKACVDVVNLAYSVGGGEFLTFKNPNNSGKKNQGDWMKCYRKSNMEKIIDSKGRTFWYDPKWKK